MLEIYNSRAVTKKQRFIFAILAGLASAIILGLIYGMIEQRISITFQIFYTGLGYLIALVIQNVGRGVQQRFSVLGAICALVCFFVSDIMQYFGFWGFIPSVFPLAAVAVIEANLSFNINMIIALIFKISGILVAYQYSRII